MKRNYIFLLSVFFILYFASAKCQNNSTTQNIKKHITYLASDELKGRKPGTPEDKLAANYILEQFKSIGLKTLGEKGFQYFDVVTTVEANTASSLTSKDVVGKLNEDFVPLAYSDDGNVKANAVFVGYGFDINLDTLKWNDYAGIDVKGKWVIVLRGDPELDNNKSAFIRYSKERSKILSAKDNGAKGVLFVSGVKMDEKDDLIKLHVAREEASAGLPVMQIKRTIADKLIKSTGKTIDELEKSINLTRKPSSFDCKTEVNGNVKLNIASVKTQNVIGIIEGNDPVLKNEYIVIGAHFDHLGMGGPETGSRRPDTIAIHHGADDNASGVAAVIEMARKIFAVKNTLKRSVIFMSFTGEEMGLLGSKFFVNNPLVDIKKIKFMVNFDMVGRLDSLKDLTVGGSGTFPKADSVFTRLNSGSPLKLSFSPDGFGPSDHASFYSVDIPVSFFFTGTHDDYHTPNDQTKFINFAGESLVLDLGYKFCIDLLTRQKDFPFQEAGPKSRTEYGRGFKVTLGIMPDYAGKENKGLLVDGASKGKPAANAGIKKGDIITAINGKAIQNIYDYMNRLVTLKSGQLISVDVLRDGKKIVILVQL